MEKSITSDWERKKKCGRFAAHYNVAIGKLNKIFLFVLSSNHSFDYNIINKYLYKILGDILRHRTKLYVVPRHCKIDCTYIQCRDYNKK